VTRRIANGQRTAFQDEDGYTRLWVIMALYAVIVVGAAALITVVVVAVDWHVQHVACLQLHEQSSYETRMVGSPLGGECYVQVDERWVPATRYRMVEVER